MSKESLVLTVPTQATPVKPPLALRALRFLGLSKYEIEILSALRVLGSIVVSAPKLATALLKATPDIQAQIVEAESKLPGKGRGREKLTMLVSALLKLHPKLNMVASYAETFTAIRAIATIVVGTFNESGMFKKED